MEHWFKGIENRSPVAGFFSERRLWEPHVRRRGHTSACPERVLSVPAHPARGYMCADVSRSRVWGKFPS